jgi:hypothetical protein
LVVSEPRNQMLSGEVTGLIVLNDFSRPEDGEPVSDPSPKGVYRRLEGARRVMNLME